jgi:hypothetical protein
MRGRSRAVSSPYLCPATELPDGPHPTYLRLLLTGPACPTSTPVRFYERLEERRILGSSRPSLKCRMREIFGLPENDSIHSSETFAYPSQDWRLPHAALDRGCQSHHVGPLEPRCHHHPRPQPGPMDGPQPIQFQLVFLPHIVRQIRTNCG